MTPDEWLASNPARAQEAREYWAKEEAANQRGQHEDSSAWYAVILYLIAFAVLFGLAFVTHHHYGISGGKDARMDSR